MKMKSMGFATALCAFLLLGTSRVQAAQPFCVSIIGEKNGAFTSSAATATRTGCANTNKITALGFAYGVISPRDMATGQQTARRQHKPIKIKKEWSDVSPQLFQALESNELLLSVTLDFFIAEATGVLRLDHSIILTNAFITAIEHSSEYYTSTEAASRVQAMETLELTFQKIELIDHKSQRNAVSENAIRQ